MKILFLDIETAPNIAYVWGLFKQDIPLARLVDSGYVLSWSASWADKGVTVYSDKRSPNMLKEIHNLLEEADVVVHYNGSRFDIPTLNKEFLKAGLKPPAPYKQIDLLKVVKKEFRFPSNKLEYVIKALGLGFKIKHAGFQLWIDCMNNDEAAWEQMREYNQNDVVILSALYHKLLPWIKNHPNVGLYKEAENVCPNCGGNHLVRRGHSYTNVGRYQRYRCSDCGTWSKGKKNDAVKDILVQDKN